MFDNYEMQQIEEARAELRKIKTPKDFCHVVNAAYDKYGSNIVNMVAIEKIASLTDDQLFGIWESTEKYDKEDWGALYMLLGWCMDEIAKRYPEGFRAWRDQSAREDSDLRRFCLVNPMCLSCSRFAAESTGSWYDKDGKCKGDFDRSHSGCIMHS